MKKLLQKHILLFAVALLALSAIVVMPNLYSAKAASNAPTVISPRAYQTIKIFVNQTIAPGQTINSNYIKIEGYKKVVLFGSFNPAAFNSGLVVVTSAQSLDGINDYLDQTPNNYNYQNLDSNAPYRQASQDVTSPYYRVTAQYGSNSTAPTVTINVSLYLMPF